MLHFNKIVCLIFVNISILVKVWLEPTLGATLTWTATLPFDGAECKEHSSLLRYRINDFAKTFCENVDQLPLEKKTFFSNLN